jgi:hypothetical protein
MIPAAVDASLETCNSGEALLAAFSWFHWRPRMRRSERLKAALAGSIPAPPLEKLFLENAFPSARLKGQACPACATA